jgi:Na+/H+ antiporter NhaD/arsenite permease-like protein
MAEYVFLGVVLAGALYLFWTQRLRTDLTAGLLMLSLVVPWPHPDGEWRAVLTYQEGFSGFGSSAVIMIGAMFVIGGAIVQTGAAEAIGLRWLRIAAKREWLLQLSILCAATLASMVINDTTVVLILLPLIICVCKENQLSPSRYLLFAA